jgi:hypothetical protein
MASVASLLEDKAGFLSFLMEADALVDRIADSGCSVERSEALRGDVHTLNGICS